ncbi:MAG: hypothetical protein NTZ90_02480 [Proteobacteria bacterium]|nr:hypothetical protein [Pseudomonadota bacterium]
MLSGSDNAANQRLDQASVVDFLTSTAGALCDYGVISTKDTDNLRLALSGIANAPSERSLLVELDLQKADFLALLTVRFGTVGVCLNLLRHTLRSPLEDTSRILLNFGQALVKKAELMFNRPFRIYRGVLCVRQTLFSSVLVDFGETLEQASVLLGTALQDLGTMNPNDLAGADESDLALDEAIAQALGFRGLLRLTLPVQSETEAKHKIAQSLEMVAEAATHLAEQLAANTGEELAHDVLAACEGLLAECQRLNLLEFPRSDSLLVWEVRRRHLISCITSLNAALAEVSRASLAAIGPDLTNTMGPLPESAKRRLTYDLMVTGVTPAAAAEAVQDLLAYLGANKVEPHTLLPAELHRIHRQLLPQTLDSLKAFKADAALMAGAGRDKKLTMERVVRLSKSFQNAASQTAATASLLMILLILSSCGLKTRLESSITEMRPDIPFRIAAPVKPVDATKSGKDTRGTTQPGLGDSPNDHATQVQP